MLTKQLLLSIINEQQRSIGKKKIIARNIHIKKDTGLITVISGVRRCGKSTVLKQSFFKEKKSLFINFEDPRLDGFGLEDFYKLEEIAIENDRSTFIYEEIQNLSEWERYVRSAYDKGLQIYITGSNASMLSRDLGTRLTGRYKQLELFPFSFDEYLDFRNKRPNVSSLNSFIKEGGFPEYLSNGDDTYLRNLLKDIVIRDIAVRRKIRNEKLLLRLAVYLMSNVGKEFSFNNITKLLNIKSVRTTIDYCDFLKESYLVEFLPRFAFSLKQQQVNPKKAYSVDTGMARANSTSMNKDLGRMLENSVYLFLRNHCHSLLYYKDDEGECDFIAESFNKGRICVQVCWQLDGQNLKREVNGLQRAIKASNSEEGIIVTFDQEDKFDDILAIPAWKWFIEGM